MNAMISKHVKHAALGAILAIGSAVAASAACAAAAAAAEQFIPMLSYRVGPYAAGGSAVPGCRAARA